MYLWNNIFVVEDGGELGGNLKPNWSKEKDLDMRGNVFSGKVSKNFIRTDLSSIIAKIGFEGEQTCPSTYAIDPALIKTNAKLTIDHPSFPAAGRGFKHVSEKQLQIFLAML